MNTLITGNFEMADRIRVHNWSKTPLGPIEDWSETLLATVNLMLHSPFPTILSWGEEMVFLYNDAAISTLTLKHPKALGADYRDVFHEAWDVVKADLEACFYRGQTAVRDNVFIPMLFNGVLEDHYWSYSLIPVYENGRIGGVYDAFRNTTETVEGARRLRESEERLKLANLQPETAASQGRILGTIRDTTEVRKGETELRESAKRLSELAAIVASSDDVILSKNLDGIITSWNDAATRVLGYTAGEMIGTSILKLIPEHLHSDEKTIIENIRAGRRVRALRNRSSY